MSVRYYLGGVACCLLSVVGLLLNAYGIRALARQRLTAIFHKLMFTLVMFDFAYVLLILICYSLPQLSPHFGDHVVIYAMPYLVPLAQICLSGSTYSTGALTLERYISICAPFFKQRHSVKAWMFIAPVVAFVFAFGSPRFFEMEVVEEEEWICPDDDNNNNNTATAAALDNTEGNCSVRSFPQLIFKDLRLNPFYVSIYANWMNLIFQLLIPVIANVVLNVSICRALHRSYSMNTRNTAAAGGNNTLAVPGGSGGASANNRGENEFKKREARYARASVFMVLMFVVCNTPRIIPNCMELFLNFEEFPEWAVVLVSVNQLLTVTSSSFNFLIYMSFCRAKKKKKAVDVNVSTQMTTFPASPRRGRS